MGHDSQKVTLGLALLVSVGASMTEAYVRVVLVLAAVFLIVWGRHPNSVLRAASRLPMGRQVTAGLSYLDSLLATGQGERRRIRDNLGEFLAEGEILSARCANEREPPPEREAVDWYNRVIAYLRDTEGLGVPFAVRFNSSAGLPLGATSIGSDQHRRMWGYFRPKLARLHKFMAEFSD